MKQKIRLGAGSGFWGDGIDPALELLDRGELDYLCFDFLAELTMALLQRQKLKNPQLGYVPDAVQYMKEMMPLARKRGTRLVARTAGKSRRRSEVAMTDFLKRGHSSVGRAPALQAGGRRFDPDWLHHLNQSVYEAIRSQRDDDCPQ